MSTSFLVFPAANLAKEAVAYLLKCRKLCLYLRYAIKSQSVFHSYPQLSTGKLKIVHNFITFL
jgi:hypothetical protein